MTMTSYAVYDADTGEVLHLHVEPAGLNSSPEEIIQLAGARGSRRLDVVQVPNEGVPADGNRVVHGRLVPADGDVEGTGAAGGGEGLMEPAVPRRYESRVANDDQEATS
jgi:hypothetical protein